MTVNSRITTKPKQASSSLDLLNDLDLEDAPPERTFHVRTPEERAAFLQGIKDKAEALKIHMTPEEFFALPEKKQRELSRDDVGGFEFYKKLSPPINWTRQLENEVMLGKQCPMCIGNEQREVPALYKGKRIGTFEYQMISCYCYRLHIKHRYLSNPWGLPQKYLLADLETLQPIPTSPLTLARQTEEIDFLRQHPSDSYFFCGRPGTSKTTFTSALIRHAFDQWWDLLTKGPASACPITPSWLWIWRINFDLLMGQIQRYEYRNFGSEEKVPPPDLTPTRIMQAASEHQEMPFRRGRPLLCLEEIDKARMTVDRLNRLEALVDAIYNSEGQVLLTTNLTYAAFAAMVIETKPETGEPLMRRIEEMCHVREYF